MSSYTRRQGISDADQALGDYGRQLLKLEGQLRKVEAASETVVAELERTSADLAVLVLPTLGESDIRAADALLGGTRLADRAAELEVERQDLLTRQRDLAENQEVIDSERLIGSLSGEGDLLRSEIEALEREVTRYNHSGLHWLRVNPKPQGGLSGLWDSVGGTSRKRQETLATVLSDFEASSIEEVETRETEANDKLGAARRRLETVESEIERISGLAGRYKEVNSALGGFDDMALCSLRSVVVEVLASADFKALQEKLSAHKLPIATAAALTSKRSLLSQAGNSLKKEIADRKQRIAAIERVRRKWVRSSKTYLKSDKSDWLRTAPQRKVEQTDTYCGHFDLLYASIMGFDDYLFYSMLLGRDSPVIPFLAFSALADDKPPMGFAASVLPDFAEQRAEYPDASKDVQSLLDHRDEQVEHQALDTIADEWDQADQGVNEAEDVGADASADASDVVDNDLS